MANRVTPPLEPLARESPVRTRSLTTSHGPTTVRTAGKGPVTVVLIHGWACDSSYWMPLMRRLPGDVFTSVAPDLPGFGGSRTGRPWSFAGCAAAVRSVLAANRAGQATVAVGHSMGGAIALLLARDLRGDERLDRVVLEAYAPVQPFRGPREERIRQLTTLGSGGGWFADVIRSWYGTGISAADLDAAVEVARAVPIDVLTASQRCILGGIPDDAASAGDGISTWIFGAQDTNRDLAAVDALAREHAATLHVLPQCGHTPHYEAPDAVDSIVRDLCAELV